MGLIGSFCPLCIIHYRLLAAQSVCYNSFKSLAMPSTEQADRTDSGLLECGHSVATATWFLYIIRRPIAMALILLSGPIESGEKKVMLLLHIASSEWVLIIKSTTERLVSEP